MSNNSFIELMSTKTIAEVAIEISRLSNLYTDLEHRRFEAGDTISKNKIEYDMEELHDLEMTLRMIVTYMEPKSIECVAALTAISSSYYDIVSSCEDSPIIRQDERAAKRCIAAIMRYCQANQLQFSGICNLHQDCTEILKAA